MKKPRISMLHAALAFAKQGYKIFPVPPNTKKSYVRRDARSGSGESWGMTNDPTLIKKYWERWPEAGIGLPTGWVNKIIVIETDNPKGHKDLEVDGEVSLQAVEKRLGTLPKTKMAESPSGSKHRIHAHPGKHLRIKNSASEIGPGIDVRGDGGMVVAPPSIRKDGVYRWINKLPIVGLPEKWISELTEEKPDRIITPLPADANWAERYGAETDDPPTLEELQEALDALPNDDVGWEQWNDVAMRLWPAIAALNVYDQGYKLFESWSRKSKKFNRSLTRQKWRRLHGNPPTRYGVRAIFNIDAGTTEEAKEWKEDPPKEINGEEAAAKLGFVGKNDDIILPFDFWDEYKVPKIPRGIFPELIERFALTLGEVRGSDPVGLAMGGLSACAAAIPDCFKLQVKPLSDPSWIEEPRLWVSMVGGVSTIKTSTLKSVRAPFLEIDRKLVAEYAKAKAEWDALDKEEKKTTEEPHCKHILIGDSTPEATQDTMRWSDDGMFNVQDELGHFFGAMDRYSNNNKGAGADRFFWTQTYEGGFYSVSRSSVKHRNYIINNCGMNLFGAIQPSVIRGYSDNSSNEGLLQRSLFVMLASAVEDKNVPTPQVQEEFNELILRLYNLAREHGSFITFTPEAEVVRTQFFNETFKLVSIYAAFNPKLGEHISKWRGVFCRICLILHVIEHHEDRFPSNISGEIAERASTLLLKFLLPHAEAFYFGVLNEAGDTPRLRAICEFILAHERSEISGRDFQASIRSTRGLKSKDINEILQQLYFVGWITPGEKKRSDSTNWVVNPLVHQLFREQARVSRLRRAELRAAIFTSSQVRKEEREM
jgi:hypothetical protein